MIHINLLPEEYRRKARTPVKVLAVLALIVSINGSLLAYWAWLAFGVAAEIETDRSVLQVEMDGLTPQVNYHNDLSAEVKAFASREQTLSEITKNRILWTRKIDELVDLVNMGGDGVRHYIWFDDLSVKQEVAQRGKSYGAFKASGHSGSAKWDQVAAFLTDVADPRLTDFIDIFATLASPEGTQNPPDEELIPSEVWSFPLSLELMSPEDRLAARLKREQEKKL